MIYLEVIELRATHGDLQEVEGVLESLARDSQAQKSDIEVGIYRHHNLESDFAIHLTREADGKAGAESSLGIRTVELLRQYGLVNYSVWYREQDIMQLLYRDGPEGNQKTDERSL